MLGKPHHITSSFSSVCEGKEAAATRAREHGGTQAAKAAGKGEVIKQAVMSSCHVVSPACRAGSFRGDLIRLDRSDVSQMVSYSLDSANGPGKK